MPWGLRNHHRRKRAFSLVELVIVVVIIGIIAAIAVPRIAGASGNASAKALDATLTNVRKAIDVYYAEHGSYPGYAPGTTAPVDGEFAKQLTLYSDRAGNTNATHGSPFIYGPYLRSPFPTNPTNNLKTVKMKANPGDPDPALGSFGWVAVLSTGAFAISATDAGLGGIGITSPTIKTRIRSQF